MSSTHQTHDAALTAASCSIDDPGKPTFTLAAFIAALLENVREFPQLAAAYVAPYRIDAALREEAMVAVSTMNRCRHCTAIHGAWAAAVGGDAQVAALAESATQQKGEPDPRQLAARYARCVVAGTAPEEAAALLAPYFSWTEQRQIAAVARGIDFANRCGNTWDALVARLSGQAQPGSSLLDELAVLALLSPVGVPFLAISQLLRTLRGEPVFERDA